MNALMKVLKKVLLSGVLAAIFLNAAQAQELTAVATAEAGVEALLQTVVASQELFNSDPEAYFNQIEEVLNTFVDFTAVAEVVMSRHGDAATDAQKQRFADILRSTLTRFYGAALNTYNGEELVFLPPANPNADPRADTVVTMELERDPDPPMRLQFQMFLNGNNEWKLKNLSLAGVNLGRQYFTQFSALMSQHNNDIDLVLDNWR